jgi:hypothetical protein
MRHTSVGCVAIVDLETWDRSTPLYRFRWEPVQCERRGVEDGATQINHSIPQVTPVLTLKFYVSMRFHVLISCYTCIHIHVLALPAAVVCRRLEGTGIRTIVDAASSATTTCMPPMGRSAWATSLPLRSYMGPVARRYRGCSSVGSCRNICIPP